MNCACRESLNIFKHPSQLFVYRNWKYKKQLMFDDSFMPIICYFKGHDPYVVRDCDNAVACKRCHRFLKF